MNMLSKYYKSFLFFLLSALLANNVYAIETINIKKGKIDPIPIAINEFSVDGGTSKTLALKIAEVISNDLRNSGLFKPISSVAFIEKKIGITHKPLFAAWRQINTNFLMNGDIRKIGNGKIKISFILWDTFLEKEIVDEGFDATENLWRRVAHKIADKIYEKITGDKGYFDSRIAYISESGPYTKRIKRAAVMDYDGANNQYLTDGKNLVLTPRFSPNADKVLYLSYINKRAPRVYMKNLHTRQEFLVGNFKGMTFAPRFSTDGSKVLMSLSKDGTTHIYEMDFKTKKTVQLTSGNNVINTSPSYSPDNKKIVFNSDRNGSRHLYVMDSDGSNLQRISFGIGAYAAPAWSPRGDYIAFTKITKGEGFTIGIMRPDPANNGERIITSGYLVEGPCWSPNGRLIMFARGERPSKKVPSKNKIYVIDLSGYNERLLPTSGEASDPEWSRLLD